MHRGLILGTAMAVASTCAANPAFAAGQTGQYATNDGTSVHVGAEEIQQSGGSGGGGSGTVSGRPVRDYAAEYEALHAELMAERDREAARRAAEAERYHALVAEQRSCAAKADHYGELAAASGGHNTVAAGLAEVYAACAAQKAEAIEAFRAQTEARRAAWDAHWAAMNQEAHAAWRILNTHCEAAGPDLQECRYGAWRNYSPGSFDRHLRPVAPRPPAAVVQAARDSITPPAPEIRMNPRVEWEQIVNLSSWLWVEPATWRTETARADAGAAWAEARAVPVRVVWDMGNGDRVTCDGPGTPYDEGRSHTSQTTGCSYTYRQSSADQPGEAYTVTATVVYDVSWTGSGGAGGDLGTLSASNTARVRVAEIQALNT